jgi:hypothetical protein
VKHFVLFLGLLLVALSQPLAAQSPLSETSIYGYFQGVYLDSRPTMFVKNNTFAVQQLDLFFNTNLGSGFSSFISLELSNSYSSERQWGNFNLEEAWVRYSYSPLFNVKFGQLVPQFGNLNEIKNRTPLLPYIQRPMVFESSYNSILDFSAYYPALANLQIYGSVNLGDIKGDYALFVGNSDPKFIATNKLDNGATGWDTTQFKMFGGRVGARAFGAKAGVTATFDRFRGFFEQGGYGFIPVDTWVGNIPRRRLGVDLSYTGYGFFFESEAIFVQHDLTPEAKVFLNAISQPVTIPIGPGATMTMESPFGNSLDKSFMYANLGYDITERIFAYIGWSNTKDKYDKVFKDMVITTVGAGFRPVESVVLKAQYAKLDVGMVPFQGQYTHNVYYLAASVSF